MGLITLVGPTRANHQQLWCRIWRPIAGAEAVADDSSAPQVTGTARAPANSTQQLLASSRQLRAAGGGLPRARASCAYPRPNRHCLHSAASGGMNF